MLCAATQGVLVWVGSNHGAGVDVTTTPDQVVNYDGTQVVVVAR